MAAWLEVGRSAAWYGFILHLYRRSVCTNEQVTTAFKTMGLVALLMLVCTPLVEWQSGSVAPELSIPWHRHEARIRHLQRAVAGKSLFQHTTGLALAHQPALRRPWGVFLYDLLLYADGVLFHRLSFILMEGRAPAIILAAPLIALAAVRNRRWAVDIHVSRDVVFHSFTLIGSGIFLLAIALIGEVFRRGGSGVGQRRRNVADLRRHPGHRGHPDLGIRPLPHQIRRGGELLQQPV